MGGLGDLSIIGLDTEVGMSFCGGDAELYLEAITTFLQDSEKKIKDMEETFENENFTDYETAVHALKSSSKTIGLMKLSDEAREIEMATKNHEMAFVKKHGPELLKNYNLID